MDESVYTDISRISVICIIRSHRGLKFVPARPCAVALCSFIHVALCCMTLYHNHVPLLSLRSFPSIPNNYIN